MTTKPGKGKGGLGRGMSALGLSESSGQEGGQGLMTLAIASVEPNVNQPREIFKEEELNELAASIKEHGLLQPIVVSSLGLGRYQIIAGERRWRAARIAGLEEIPAVVKEVSPDQMLVLALVENIQRADLDPLEEAQAYKSLQEEYGLTQQEIGERVGKSRVAVTNALALLRFPTSAQQKLRAGEVSAGHLRALQGIDDDHMLELAVEEAIEHQLTVRQTEEMARMVREGSTPAQARETILQRGAKPRRAGKREGGERQSRSSVLRDDDEMISIDDQAVEDQIRRRLTTEVKLIRRGRGGEIIIHFANDEILQSIYELIVGSGLD